MTTQELIQRTYEKEQELLEFGKNHPIADARSAALFQTNVEQAFMWLRRAISGVKQH